MVATIQPPVPAAFAADAHGLPVRTPLNFKAEEDRQKAVQVGCDGYLAKPVEPRRVVQEVERFVGPA